MRCQRDTHISDIKTPTNHFYLIIRANQAAQTHLGGVTNGAK